ALWAGETVDHAGLVRVHQAKLYSLPARPPRVIGAALSAETARWMGSWVDGLITAGTKAEHTKKTLDAFREGGGEGKPVYLQTIISIAPTIDEAVAIAHREWRQAGVESHE